MRRTTGRRACTCPCRAVRRSVWARPRRGCPRHDAGFSLVEAVAAMSIMMLVLVLMVTMSIQSVRSLTLSRQRQEASGLASRALEQIRALPYTMTSSGLVPTDATGDANIVTVGGIKRLRITEAGIDEPLVVKGSSTAVAPLFPHRATTAVDGVTYTVSTYITQTAIDRPYLLTAMVTWSSSVSQGVRRVVQRSADYSPGGCLSLDTHPYSGPCRSAFTGQAGATGASIVISSGSGTAGPITGYDATSLSLIRPGVTSTLVNEQIASTAGRATTTGARSATASGTSAAGQLLASASTSTDPTSGQATTSTATVGQSGSSQAQISGTAGTLTATVSSGDTASATGFAAAATACADALGGSLPTGQPCTYGSATSAGSDASVRADLKGASSISSLDNFDVVRIAPAPTAARTVVAQVKTTGSGGCPSTSGTGCVYAAASRSMGTAVFGTLPPNSSDDDPADLVPAGFTGLVRVTGLSESARAESGTGERAPTFSRTGTLSVWNGTGYTPVDLSAVGASSHTPQLVTANYHGGGDDVTIAVSGDVTIGSTAYSSTGTDPCQDPQCTRTARGSEITVRIAYVVSSGAAQLTYFVLTANLGSLLTTASHVGAPSA